MMLMEPLRCSCERGGVVAWVRESPGLVSVAESPGYRQADVGATNAATAQGEEIGEGWKFCLRRKDKFSGRNRRTQRTTAQRGARAQSFTLGLISGWVDLPVSQRE